VPDHLWLWGAYGRNQIGLVSTGGFPSNSTLENINLKLNAQTSWNNSLTAAYYRSDKIGFGQGGSLQRPPETSYAQTGPANTFKLESGQTFSSDLFVSVSGAYKDFAFHLEPEGSGQMRQDSAQVFHTNYLAQSFYRPDAQFRASASRFFRTG